MSVKREILNFNHISKNLSESDLEALKNLYKHYHKKTWCYKKAYQYFRRFNISLNIASIVLTSTGTIVGGVTLNPIVRGTITGSGVALQGFIKMKKYNRKIEMSKFAFTSYQKVLNKIRAYLRGEKLEINDLVLELQLLDDQVTDLCPLIDKYKKSYNSKFKTD